MFDLLVTILFFYGVYRLFRYLKAPVQKPRHNIPISGPGHHYNNSTNRLNIKLTQRMTFMDIDAI